MPYNKNPQETKTFPFKLLHHCYIHVIKSDDDDDDDDEDGGRGKNTMGQCYLRFTGSNVALTAPAKIKVHENGVYHIWVCTILFLACSGTPQAGRNPSCLHDLPVQLHHQLSGAHCVMANKLLSHCVPILFFILTHASCIEFRANKEAVKTLLLSTV
jgi:hypothetical protein